MPPKSFKSSITYLLFSFLVVSLTRVRVDTTQERINSSSLELGLKLKMAVRMSCWASLMLIRFLLIATLKWFMIMSYSCWV